MKQYHDYPYLNLVKDVLENGVEKGDRTGTGTKSVFGREMRFDLSDGSIPLLTSKKMHTKSIIYELLWFLSGDTNVDYLQDNGVRIWNEWMKEDGTIGPGYGYQWRSWPKPVEAKINYETDPPSPIIKWKEIDQIAQVIGQLRNNPNDRRIIVSAWNVGQLEEMSLPPCHYAFQFWVEPFTVTEQYSILENKIGKDEVKRLQKSANMLDVLADHRLLKGKLSLKLNMRSSDVGLGLPFNIVQYSILLHMISQVTNLQPGEFIYSGGDVHIYNNHVKQLTEQLKISPYPSPTLKLNQEVKEIDDFKFEDFEIIDYKSHPVISMQVSV